MNFRTIFVYVNHKNSWTFFRREFFFRVLCPLTFGGATAGSDNKKLKFMLLAITRALIILVKPELSQAIINFYWCPVNN